MLDSVNAPCMHSVCNRTAGATSSTSAATSTSAAARAYEYAKELVTACPASASAFLTKDEIAVPLGVSRTPAREALSRLAAEHLLELHPGRGAFTPPISAREMADVIAARSAVESFVVAHISNPDELGKRLGDHLNVRREVIDDPEAFIKEDRSFHMTLVEASSNRIPIRFYDLLRDRMLRIGILAVSRETGRSQQVILEHEAIVDALLASDLTGAAETAERHLSNTLHSLVESSV